MGEEMMEHLTESRNNLVKEMIVLSSEAFNYCGETHEWSIAQVCHHLYLVERASTKAIDIGLRTSDERTAEQKSLQFILDRTKKRKAPDIVEPGDGPYEVQQILRWLQDSRSKLTELINSLEDKSILARKSFRHPVYGNLSLYQWVELLDLHEQRHIEQIKELKRVMGIRN
jgi:hypothetical protein